jgi:hypothetical protein
MTATADFGMASLSVILSDEDIRALPFLNLSGGRGRAGGKLFELGKADM